MLLSGGVRRDACTLSLFELGTLLSKNEMIQNYSQVGLSINSEKAMALPPILLLKIPWTEELV